MSSPSIGRTCNNSKLSNYNHTFDFHEEYATPTFLSDCEINGIILPRLLNDFKRNNEEDLAKVTSDVGKDSIVVCSVNSNPAIIRRRRILRVLTMGGLRGAYRLRQGFRRSSSGYGRDRRGRSRWRLRISSGYSQDRRGRSLWRLRTALCRADHNGDGRITRDEVQEEICIIFVIDQKKDNIIFLQIMVEIMMALEEQFGVSIGEGGAENIVTVQDAAVLIEKVRAA
ncbi:hypothetical protein K2173_017349 [Erythroxylum novogranatense]|uniref:EF-hand domain-containing protein n=1 Tax=Erythroxylum novogranatense TaxID=1862640 RepID=A0AAV8TK96_9ROSI|nr:hypothetical protein K2173_017349 [Erythroxylum novogranatense]